MLLVENSLFKVHGVIAKIHTIFLIRTIHAKQLLKSLKQLKTSQLFSRITAKFQLFYLVYTLNLKLFNFQL